MPNLGAAELLTLVVVALLVFGPRKLPELARTVGQTLRELRRSTAQVTDDLRGELGEVRDRP